MVKAEIFGAELYGDVFKFDQIFGYDFPDFRPLVLEMVEGFPEPTTLDFRVRIELQDDKVFVFDNLKFHIR